MVFVGGSGTFLSFSMQKGVQIESKYMTFIKNIYTGIVKMFKVSEEPFATPENPPL